ncbi:MAG: UDP-N-acetylglucosamine 1-carboxyvinyltransferase [Kiritimatiellae bacterium]|nr:UDP-N-acetylglucosamine 1-carboxyvinyltransferase [Kiritimatiellia bacterium]
MARFIIRGGNAVGGTMRPVGNKNAALPMIAAALLTDEPVRLSNVPRIEDVRVMLDLLRGTGAEVSQRGGTVTIVSGGGSSGPLNRVLCTKVRSSILLAGPLAARRGRVVLAPPGGDVIGRRRLDTHFYALRALGIDVRIGSSVTFQRKKLAGAEILLDEASVTATENAMMAAVLAPGRTVIYNAACEPHVQDLGVMLVKMGARIEGLGTNRIEIRGVRRLHGAAHRVGADYIEIGSFIAAAAATGGALDIPLDGDSRVWLPVVEKMFQTMGISWSVRNGKLHMPARQEKAVQSAAASDIPTISDGIWPAFPSDLMSVAIVLATQSSGTALFFEKLFESRMYFVDHLISMGARIVQCDPHRVVVVGPSRLRPAHMSSPDIRAGMALLIAALCARGESVIENAQIIDRGYERIEEKLRALGADIRRVE